MEKMAAVIAETNYKVTSRSGREKYYMIRRLQVSILHAFSGGIEAAAKTKRITRQASQSVGRGREEGGREAKKKRMVRLM